MKTMRASHVESQFFVSSRLHPTPALNTLAFAVRIEGAIDPDRLSAAVETVVCKHPSLRTRFGLVDGEIVRTLMPDGHSPAMARAESPNPAEAIASAVEQLRRGLSPDDRTWGTALLRHAGDVQTLVCAFHRVIWDESSTRVFADDLSRAYASGDDEGEAALPAAGSVAGSDDAGDPAPFAQSLDGVPRLHGFPTKAPRPRQMAVSTDEVAHRLSDDLVGLLRDRASAWGIPVFQLQCAAAAYVLAAHAGQPSLAVGLPFDLRSPGPPFALGSHTAILPVGVDTAVPGGFESFARAFADTHVRLGRDAHVPFDQIVAACKAKSDPGANSIFQIACVEDVAFLPRFPGCVVTPIPVAAPPQQLDLFLSFSSSGMKVAFASEIIERQAVDALVRSYAVFLRAALTDPGLEVSRLPLMTEDDRAALSQEARAALSPEFPGADVFALVSRHFATKADAVAVACAGQSVTYAGLARRVDDAAARLAAENLPPGSLVGVCLPRSTDMLATLLAVLRQGMAYVPLDPAFPRERLRYMVEHSKLTRIVATAGLRGLFEGVAVGFVDPTGEAGAVPPPAAVAPDAAAYVIYTSGSTGKPKGVAVPRGAMANFLASMLVRPGIDETDTLVAVTTLSFDIAVLELFAPLCAGGTVVIATEEEAKDPRLLASVLRERAATILQATPVTWQMLLGANLLGEPKVKALCGGEAMTPSLARALLPRTRALWNMYGPTETTVWSTCHRIEDGDAPIAVGTPIHNTPIYILDDHGRPLPKGVEGRLFIGGAGVAKGYLHAPELTSHRFLPDPFLGEGRMYDTGDRARLFGDGLLYVVGRADFQVKLRGFRIELGEIEACIAGHLAVEQVVCVVRRDDPENPELAAYYVCREGMPDPGVSALREHASGTLPAHMIPSRWVCLSALPRTPNGKVDRASLPKPASVEPAAPAEIADVGSELEGSLAAIWGELLSLPQVGTRQNFFELGGTSLAAFQLVQRISARLGLDISVLKVFEHPTVASLAAYLSGRAADNTLVRAAYDRGAARRARAASPTEMDVAVVGMAGRFPGARTLDEMWAILRDGRETITVWKREELDPLVSEADRNDPNYIPARGILEDADKFDAAFFGITPNEAELMDPQLRVFLEVAHEAFEHAGYVGERLRGEVGVWAGMGNNFYYHHNVLTRPDKLAMMGDIAAEIANEKDHIAPRVSYKLNLSGPSLSVHTACSTTLVVVENAYQALVSRQVDVALAGGVDIRTPQKSGQRHEEGGPFSDDGHCRPFDAAATGTMFGEGVGALVLKRLSDAIADGDTIHGVIKGAAVNHDGGHKVSYLAPSVEGQAKVIATAMGLGGVEPETISFVEAHGTATPIGDPIEVEALTRVHRTFTARRHYCALGSVKGNFGHATTAAGIAGCLKVLLAMRHEQIPATLHFRAPNPRIDFAGSPFFVNDTLIPWEPKGMPRRAGVSSFGFCGTNAHVIFEEPPAVAPSAEPVRREQLFLISARHPQALEDGAKRLGDAVAAMNGAALADAAYTTQVGRKRFEHRRCAVIAAGTEGATVFTQAEGPASSSLSSSKENPPVSFLFPGQGSQYINMGLRLYQGEPVYRNAVDRCATLLAPHLGLDLRTFLFPDPGDEATATESLNNTFYTQPAIFTVSYSLAALLQHAGVSPARLLGHSIGEFVAATLADVMDLESALALVAARGRLMQSLPRGSMLSVRLSAEEVEPRLPAGVDIAAINGPKLCVVAGPTPILAEWSDALGKDNIVTRMLHTSHAFHSSMMDPVVEPFLRVVERVALRPPRIPIASTVTGAWMKPAEATNPAYWARHLRSTVRYSNAVQVLLADPANVLIECGPRRTCQALALQHRPKNPARVLATMPDSGEVDQEHTSFLLALGGVWMQGGELDVARLHGGQSRRRVPLPTYAFQRKRFWIDPGVVSQSHPVAAPRVAAEAPPSGAQGPDALSDAVCAIVEELLGAPLESRDPDARFVALGLDSLLLTQMARAVRQRLGFEVTFRELAQKYSSPRLLTEAVRAASASSIASAPAAPRPAAPAPTPAAPAVTADAESDLYALMEELLGAPLESRDPDARFVALGLDSLLLTQMARAVRQRLGFEVTFRELAQKYSSPRLLLDAIAGKRAPASPTPAAIGAVAHAVPSEKPAAAAKDLPGARLGRDARGRPAWFIPDPHRPGKFIQVPSHD